MASANEGWAGGTLGLMLHYQNGTWTPISPNPASFTIEGIDMLNENEGWAVGYSGTILHYTNGTWTPQTSSTSNNLLNVHMLNSNEGWAVGTAVTGDPTILRYDGTSWRRAYTDTLGICRIFMLDSHRWLGCRPDARRLHNPRLRR